MTGGTLRYHSQSSGRLRGRRRNPSDCTQEITWLSSNGKKDGLCQRAELEESCFYTQGKEYQVSKGTATCPQICCPCHKGSPCTPPTATTTQSLHSFSPQKETLTFSTDRFCRTSVARLNCSSLNCAALITFKKKTVQRTQGRN